MAQSQTNGLHQLKLKAAEYYSNQGPASGVIEHMEELLNSMFYENPEDVYGHVSNFFEKLAKPPSIAKISAREVLDSRGLPTLQIEIYCRIKNVVKLITSFESGNGSQMELPSVEERDETEYQKSVDCAIQLINEKINDLLIDVQPADQFSIDCSMSQLIGNLTAEYEIQKMQEEKEKEAEPKVDIPAVVSSVSRAAKDKSAAKPSSKQKISSISVIIPEEPPELVLPGSSSLSAVSQAVSICAANLVNLPLYEHLAQTLDPCETKLLFPLPMPMITIMTLGRLSTGKVKCAKEYMIIPGASLSLEQTIKYANKIYNHCAKAIGVKAGGTRCCADNGGLCPIFERPEQGLDLLQEAITQLGLKPGKDFYLAINCAAHEMWDNEKAKYEVAVGQQKTGEEMTKFWMDIIARYPTVVALIDPMRKTDKEHWMRLCEGVSRNCFIIGSSVYHRPRLLKDEELTADFKTSAVVVRLQELTTISDAWCCIKKMQDARNQIVIGGSFGDACNTTIVDLSRAVVNFESMPRCMQIDLRNQAVACSAKFVKIGGPVRGERTCKLNRLLQIKAQLCQENKFVEWSELEFRFLRPPTPPPPPEASVLSPNQSTTTSRAGQPEKKK